MSNTYCGSPAVIHVNKGQPRNIIVNEVYGPVKQGEGKSAGKEVMFLRTSGCNLACVWCDTPYSWNWQGTKFEHPDKFDPKKEMHQMSPDEVLNKLRELSTDIRALVISGGEPMLQQDNLIPLLEKLREDNYWLEVETNGTRAPNDRFIELIDQINCSPKLSNSGLDNPVEKRIKEDALQKIASSEKTTFKFVIGSDQDIPEILSLVERFQMKQVYLMPLGKTKEEQELRIKQVEQLCQQYGFKFSPRLHVIDNLNHRGI